MEHPMPEFSGDGDRDTLAKTKKVPYLPPCRVCGKAASGFHYGANTCEACKGFFRRSLSRQTPYSQCSGECNLQKTGRISCAACRYNKCLSIGMSRQAIKNGRYTHAKRTLDTLEIKYGSSSSPSSSTSAGSQSNSPISSHLPLDLSVSQPGVGLPTDLCSDTDDVEHLLGVICNAFRIGFPNTVYLYENCSDVDRMVDSVMKEPHLVGITSCIGSKTTDEEKKFIETLTVKATLLSSIEKENSSLSIDRLWELPDYRLAFKELFEMWSNNVEKFIKDFVIFAKQLPVFASLPVQDQILQIKCARAEAVVLVKCKHFKMRDKVVVNYETETNTMILVPTRIIHTTVLGQRVSDYQSDYEFLFKRALKTISALDVTIPDLAVMCTLSLLAPDREGLSEETRVKLTKLQDQLVRVLEFSLKRSHPNARGICAKFLLLLPMLRELNEYNNQALIDAQLRLELQLSPLIQEVLHTPTKLPQSLSTPPETPTFSDKCNRYAFL